MFISCLLIDSFDLSSCLLHGISYNGYLLSQLGKRGGGGGGLGPHFREKQPQVSDFRRATPLRAAEDSEIGIIVYHTSGIPIFKGNLNLF